MEKGSAQRLSYPYHSFQTQFNMQTRAIIVEDEDEGMNVLSLKLEKHCPSIDIIDKCYTHDDAIKSIESKNPDLVFLDVRLDKKTGFDILKRLAHIHFEVIFVTGYDEFAQRAIRVGALDYILKPVKIEELRNAVNKAKKNIERLQNITRIILPVTHGIRIIPVKDIIYCSADDNFTKVYVKGESKFIHTPRNLGKIESKLPSRQFYRIHKKSIVNLCFVKEFRRAAGGSVLLSDEKETELRISREKREGFLTSLSGPMDFCKE